MENHPIPQDVTGFQFKLIGNMTVKQFAYIASGAIVSVLLFYSPLFVLIKFPFILLFGGFGVALAFLPIDGRPLDVMVGQFVKALIMPTQFMYHKMGVHLVLEVPKHTGSNTNAHQKLDKEKEKKRQNALRDYLSRNTKKHVTEADQKESIFLMNLLGGTTSSSGTVPDLSGIQLPSISVSTPPVYIPGLEDQPVAPVDTSKMEEILKEEAEKTRKALAEAQKEEAEAAPSEDPTHTATTHAHTLELQQQLAQIEAQKKQLEEQLIQMKHSMDQSIQPTQVYTTQEGTTEEKDNHVKKILPQAAKSKGILHTPDTANVLIGIITDPRGNILSNILVEVKDSEGNPVRAFKTNELGQFASATPLRNGVYTIVFEDPKEKNRFDTIELVANGEILSPIEVVSHDEREELRRALFA